MCACECIIRVIISIFQAAYGVCNIAHHSSELLIHTLDKNGLVEMVQLLHSTDEEVITMALCYLEMVLKQDAQVGWIVGWDWGSY